MALRILLADDSMTAQKMGREILTSAGYEVIAVSNGAAAAKKLAEKPDIFILDVFMPGYTGLEVCEKVRANADLAKAPVILTVAKMEPYDPKDGQRVKADAVIIKPFEATDLLAIIKKFADQLTAPPPQPSSHEKTAVFQAPQIKEFEDPSYQDWKEETATFDHPPELTAPAKVKVEVPQEMSDAPAFADIDNAQPVSMEMPVPVPPLPMAFDTTVNIPPPPKQMPGYDDTVHYPKPVVTVAPPAPPVASDFSMQAPLVLTPIETGQFESLLQPPPLTVESATTPSALAADSLVEFTSSPKAGHVEVVHEAGLEESPEEAAKRFVPMQQDPALVTDPAQIATEFVTKFGTEKEEATAFVKGFEKPDVSGVPVPTEAATTPVEDDFEARVAAAMASFADEPAAVAESPAPVVETAAPILIVEPTPEPIKPETVAAAPLPGPIPIEPMPEPQEIAPIVSMEAAFTAVPDSQAQPAGLEDTQRIEVPIETAPPSASEIHEAHLSHSGMEDAALVEQMQAAFKDLPEATQQIEAVTEPELPAVVHGIGKATMAGIGAAAAAAVAGVVGMAAEHHAEAHTAPPSSGPDLELASQLAAAVGAEPPPSVPVASETRSESTSSGLDSKAVSQIVNRVLERMLPSIVSEVARELEAAKRK